MTAQTDPLDRLAPALGWAGDWDDVLERAGESARARPRLGRVFRRRRLVFAFAVLVCVLIPIVAVAAANDWWFFRYGGAPTPLHAPLVVKEGEWSGHPWQLIAYPSSTDGLCYSITPSPEGAGAAMSCAPIVGLPRTQETKPSPDMAITFMVGSGTVHLPAYIAGPVVESAEQVEVDFGDGYVLRVATFPAPESVGRVRFYATPVSESASPQRIVGLDGNGKVVACLVPRTAVSGVSPLADCR